MAMRYKRRRRKNPAGLSLGSIFLVGLAAGGVYAFFVHKKSGAKQLAAATAAMVGTSGPPGTGSQPVLAAGNGYLLKRDPGGAPMCFDVMGNKAPVSKCASMNSAYSSATSMRKLIGMGSLGHSGLGSLS